MKRITALVTGAASVTGLGAARALRAAGANVVGFAKRLEAPACHSRCWHAVHPIAESDDGALVDQVLTTGAAIDGPVFLMPTDDDHVGEFARLREHLPQNIRLATPPPEVVELLLEKEKFVNWAEKEGYPIPYSRVVTSLSDLRGKLDGFRFPALLKPTVRTPQWQTNSPVQKNIRLECAADLQSLPFDPFEAVQSYVLSEWIDGEDGDVRFCLAYLDEESEILASFTGRKLLQYPRLVGSTAVCTGISDPELEKMTADLLRDAGCTGLASLEVKVSAERGTYLITEPTVGRPNLQSDAAAQSGVNLLGIAMRHTWGQGFSDLVGPRKGLFWMEEAGLASLLTTCDQPSLQYGLLARSFLSARRVKCAYLRFSDPGPFSALVRGWVSRGNR